jgi:hypothetical protein
MGEPHMKKSEIISRQVRHEMVRIFNKYRQKSAGPYMAAIKNVKVKDLFTENLKTASPGRTHENTFKIIHILFSGGYITIKQGSTSLCPTFICPFPLQK